MGALSRSFRGAQIGSMTMRDARPRAANQPSTPLLQRFGEMDHAAHLASALDPRLAPLLTGAARLEWSPNALRLTVGPTDARGYCNAQIDDFASLRPRAYPWRPPLRLRVRARASRPAADATNGTNTLGPTLRGTAGFGFWNGSPSITGGTLRAPESLWFFAASPPSNMALSPEVPGYGWKAQAVHAQRWGALAATAPLAATALWARLGGDERPSARWLNRLTGAREALLDPRTAGLGEWHDYEIEWRANGARFMADNRDVLTVASPPRGPLGFVTWIDTQYAVATPRGELRFGALATDEQWLELAEVSVQPL
jgi:hypothetical protein